MVFDRKNSGFKMALLVGAVGIAFSGCGPVQFSQKPADACPVGQVCVVNTQSNEKEETFLLKAGTNKVDILFVVDNSGSMNQEQASLSTRFTSFVSSLVGNNNVPLDWQIGITTTNVCQSPGLMYDGEAVGSSCPQQGHGNPPGADFESVGAQGALLPLVGGSGKILTKNTVNADSIFRDTVQIPLSKTGSGDERPIAAAHLTIDKRDGANIGFFRSDAALAVVILTDEDERSNGTNQRAYDLPEHLRSHVVSAFGANKSFRVHTINIRNPIDPYSPPGSAGQQPDVACFNDQQQIQPPFNYRGSYGTIVESLAFSTGGKVVNICDTNYTPGLQGIAGNIMPPQDAVTISSLPQVGSVSVKYLLPGTSVWKTGAELGIVEHVNGNTITFTPTPVPGTYVKVRYIPAAGSAPQNLNLAIPNNLS